MPVQVEKQFGGTKHVQRAHSVKALTKVAPYVFVMVAGASTTPLPDGAFGWIRAIEAGPLGQKISLNASTVYLIDRQYQLPQGTEIRGAGTAPNNRTVIKAVGKPYAQNCGAFAKNRKGLVLGDNTVIRGLHLVGMETARLDCLTAMIETPGAS